MGKKILGYLFYLLGILCVMSVIGNIMGFLSGKEVDTNIQLLEEVFALVLAGFLSYVFFKYGKKWTSKNKATKKE